MSLVSLLKKAFERNSEDHAEDFIDTLARNAVAPVKKEAPKQQEYTFFAGDAPSAEQRLEWLNPDKPTSPYYGFVGNRRAIKKLIRIDFDARGRYNHACPDISLAFIGQPGCGKTELARRHAKANMLPLVEISPRSVKTLDDILNQIAEVCHYPPRFNPWIRSRINLTLRPVGVERFLLPPMNVFIDEVHALSNGIVQGLLKATESKDRILKTESGNTVDCKFVHWMIATTDRGKLFDAFDTRFSKISLNLYSQPEIMQIVKLNFPEWPLEPCRLVAHYCSRMPREALAFAKEMQLEYNMYGGEWSDIAASVASDNEIDEFGMTFRRLSILKALGQGPVAEKRLPIVAGVKQEELDKFIMPWLLSALDGEPALVTVSRKGYTITEAGIEELNKRSIDYDESAIAE